MRQRLVQDTKNLLSESGFEVSDTCNIRPKSFDLVARRADFVLLAKVLSNIDSFDGETADEMTLVSSHLGASPLIIGRKSRDHELEDGVLYLRHGIPAVNLQTAYDYFVEGVPPLVYMARGGLYANIDGDLLEDLRKEEDRSLGQVAKEIGVSRRSVSKYESGMDATLDVALRLEEMFEESLLSPIDLFEEYEEEIDDLRAGAGVEQTELDEGERTAFALLQSAGFDVLPTNKAPFRALSHEREDRNEHEYDVDDKDNDDTMLTGTVHHSGDLVKRARLMSSISKVTRTRSIYIVDESSNKDSIEDTVIIEVNELEDIDESEELDEVYKEKSE
ncbi:MAG: transcriptional regulator [Halobacteria archaeon]|nr:transcriptional regulator [Halobacteria archaeon]